MSPGLTEKLLSDRVIWAMRILKAGIIYFVIVFGAGFLLGPLRILFLVPRVGITTAELIESPVMLVVIFFAARRLVRRYLPAGSTGKRLGMGIIAFGLLLAVEIAATPYLWGVSFTDYIKRRDPVANAAFGVMLIVFALMPLVVAREKAEQADKSPKVGQAR